jgi:hypothetical protein
MYQVSITKVSTYPKAYLSQIPTHFFSINNPHIEHSIIRCASTYVWFVYDLFFALYY